MNSLVQIIIFAKLGRGNKKQIYFECRNFVLDEVYKQINIIHVLNRRQV